MGAFKPLLPFGDRTIAECCVRYLLEGGAQTVVVVIGHRQEEMRERLSHLPINFAVNADAGSEMSASIARGVEQLSTKTKAILIAPVDLPAIPPEVPRALIEEWRQTCASIVVPEYAGRGGHPVLLDGRNRAALLNLDRQRGLRAFFDKHRSEVVRVPVPSPYIVRDMDTWDDYRALYKDVFGAQPPVEHSV